MEMLTFFLNVTSGAPFSFTLYNEGLYYVGDAPSVQLILSKLRDYSMQWVNASMKLREPDFLLLRSVKNRVPLLQSLGLVLQSMKTHRHDLASITPERILGILPHLSEGSMTSWGSTASATTLSQLLVSPATERFSV